MATSLYSQQQPRPEDILSRLTFDSNRRLSGSPDDVSAICRLSKEWLTPPMSNFLALSAKNQKIVIQAADESFDASAYLEAVTAVLQGVVEGSISPEVGTIALFPSPSSDMEGVIAVNHADPRVAKVLPALLARYRDDSEESEYIRMLISGKAKRDHIKYCDSHGIRSAQVISKVASGGSASSSLINTAPVPKKAPEAKPLSQAPTEEPSSALSWSFIALLIAGSIEIGRAHV